MGDAHRQLCASAKVGIRRAANAAYVFHPNRSSRYLVARPGLVERYLEEEKIDFAAFEMKYNERTNVLSKTLIFLFIPIFAAIFYALFFRRRPYFVEHAVVAIHLWSFILLLLALIVPAIGLALMWWSKALSISAVLASHDSSVSIFLQGCIAVYLALMLRRVYAATYWYCASVALLIAWFFFQVVWLYRFLLFTITLHSL